MIITMQCKCGAKIKPAWVTLNCVKVPKHKAIHPGHEARDGFCLESTMWTVPYRLCDCGRTVQVQKALDSYGYMRRHMPLRPGFTKPDGYCWAGDARIKWSTEVVTLCQTDQLIDC